MKLREVLDFVDKMKPGNPYDTATKIQWLNELEGDIQSHLLNTAPQEIIQYTESDMDATLLIPAPFDRVYWPWVAAMIDFANGEYSKYQNTLQLVNDAYDKYAKWFHRKFHEDTGGFLFIGGTTKYGLSAYEIARNHGFEGSEEEWLAALTGPEGPAGPPGEGLNIVDQVATEAELPNSGLKAGTGYLVGEGADALLFIWNGSEWFFKQSLRGEQGIQGKTGETGARGPQGEKGEPGEKGDTGATGPKGDTGATGPKGDKGDKGEKGDTGPQGPSGKDGAPGRDGSDGKDGSPGSPGKDGTSVTVTKIVESSESGGSNIVEFSDGSILNVKNGKDGEGGTGGGTVELDTTLTKQGKAADAKAVGDALNGKLSKSGGTMTGKIVFPTGDQNVGFANGQDMKIFGYGPVNGTMHMRMGDTQYPFQIRGNGDRPKYNNDELALKSELDAAVENCTPVRGEDYWTDADKAEIKSYVDEAILGGAW